MIFPSLALLVQAYGAGCAVPAPSPGQYPEVVNTLMNLVTIVIVAYVTSITRRLDKEMNHGGE